MLLDKSSDSVGMDSNMQIVNKTYYELATLNEVKLSETLLFMRKILKDGILALTSDQIQISSNDQYYLRCNGFMLKLAKAEAWNYLPVELKNLRIQLKSIIIC